LEFPDIKPDTKVNIAIYIASTPGSPDQNAKMSDIEILKP
jgi:hypothetical protein